MLDNKDIEKLDELFVTKDDFKIEIEKLATKNDVNEILTGQDKILGKLETLLQEKTAGGEQDKRKKRFFQIHNVALKRNKILSSEEAAEIDALNVVS